MKWARVGSQLRSIWLTNPNHLEPVKRALKLPLRPAASQSFIRDSPTGLQSQTMARMSVTPGFLPYRQPKRALAG